MIDGGVTVQLPSGLSAPGLARAFVLKYAADLAEETRRDAELLVSELVTNAVRYGRPDITLSVRADPPGIGVAVHDEGESSELVPGAMGDFVEQSGRGLLIVAAVASSWGVTSSEQPGKTVWFHLSGA